MRVNEVVGSPCTETVGVLVVDDDRLFREALAAIFEDEARIEVRGEACDGERAVELALELAPDVVLMDISMPTLDGIAATRRLGQLAPRVPVVVLTGSNAEQDRAAAHEAGAAGYVVKERIADELVAAVLDAALS